MNPTLRASVRSSLFLAVALPLLLAACAPSPDRDGALRPGESRALFNGKDLTGWFADVPEKDAAPDLPASFVVRDGMLVSVGTPEGHLITEERFRDFRLVVEYRFSKEAGNCGVLVHTSTPRALYGMFPRSIEVQLHSGNAGDFWCIGEDVRVEDMERRRPRREGQAWGGAESDARRIFNLTDDSERAIGDWNTLEVECLLSSITVWVNGVRVNHGFDCTATEGRIAIQAEGTEVEFRRIELLPPKPPSS